MVWCWYDFISPLKYSGWSSWWCVLMRFTLFLKLFFQQWLHQRASRAADVCLVTLKVPKLQFDHRISLLHWHTSSFAPHLVSGFFFFYALNSPTALREKHKETNEGATAARGLNASHAALSGREAAVTDLMFPVFLIAREACPCLMENTFIKTAAWLLLFWWKWCLETHTTLIKWHLKP